MSLAYYSDYTVEAKLDGSNWTDITGDVIGDITFDYGIKASGPLDRIGDPGELKIRLNNTETNTGGVTGYYSPGHPSCRSGFTAGLPIRITLTYDGATKTKWYGEIVSDGIEVHTGQYSRREVRVTARDWMHQASIHELITPTFVEDKKISEVVALILANMEKQPLATDYKVGETTFGSVFDTVKSTTKALTEFGKLAKSELGYIYITRKTGDEVLRVEGRNTRANDVGEVSTIPIDTENCSPITTEDGAYLLTEDEAYYLVADDVDSPVFDNSMMDLQAGFGKQQYNRIKVTAYPRIVDAAATTILFSLNAPVEIAAGATVTLTGRYRHPDGTYQNVAGIDMQAPVATTDYLMNANSAGTGTNLTADLTVTPTYGTGDVAYSLTNTGGTKGYVTKLNAVGKGVYTPDPVDYIAEDATSISAVGPMQLNLDMKYRDDPTIIASIAEILLFQSKDGKLMPEKATFIANRSSTLMNAFIQFEPGDRVNIVEDVSGTDADYFINGIEVVIKPGGLIKFSWYLRNAAFDTWAFAKWDVDNWDTGRWDF